MNDMHGGTGGDAGLVVGEAVERQDAVGAAGTTGATIGQAADTLAGGEILHPSETGAAIDLPSDLEFDAEATAAGQSDAQAAGQGAARYFPHVHESLLRAESASHDAGTRIIAQAYEEQRLVGVASLETLIAHAQLALAGVKWEPENHGVIIEYLVQARRCLASASDAIEARLQLADLEGRHQVARDVAISGRQA